jgi:glutamine phosphoribosylpyrophosphate amidotransferase
MTHQDDAVHAYSTNPWAVERDDGDKLREECGIFGVYGAAQGAAAMVALGLHALQHRGQEAVGISAFDGQRLIRIVHLAMLQAILMMRR